MGNLFGNKKGDVPIMVLVIGTFVICALALLSFHIVSVNIAGDFSELNYVEKMNSKVAKYNFLLNKGVSELEAIEIINEEDFYYNSEYFEINETENDFEWAWSLNPDDWSEEKLVFSVKYYRE